LKMGSGGNAADFVCDRTASADGDADRGKTLFTRCSSCHAVTEQNKVGPHLSGVFGRTAGTVAGARLLQGDDRVGHDVGRTDARSLSDRADQGSARHIGGAPPPPHLVGRKDVVLVEDKVELLVTFNQPATRDHPFMYHCHILEHEEAGLMGQYVCA
jgi:Multicopper oxidase/Cytochrome c